MAPQIAAYEREIGTLREELLKEIGHLEEKKEAAVKAAANCSEEHLQSLQNQFISGFTVYILQILIDGSCLFFKNCFGDFMFSDPYNLPCLEWHT